MTSPLIINTREETGGNAISDASLYSLFADIIAFEAGVLDEAPHLREWLQTAGLLVSIEKAVRCMPPRTVGDLREVSH